jgi:hypothetical protein
LEVQRYARMRLVAHTFMTLGAVVAVLLSAAANFHR